MSALVLAAIAASVAELERVTDVPVAPFGYGTDISCTSDLDSEMREIDPMSVEGLAQALLRRLDCPRGGLPGEPDYGIDVVEMLNRGVDASTLLENEAEIENELGKDDRVSSVKATVTLDPGGLGMRIALLVTPANALDRFALTFAVSSAGIVIEELLAA